MGAPPHPRLKLFPHHADYVNLPAMFRPFVMAVHQPLYRSAPVNTDKFGLREQYGPDGAFMDLERLRERWPACNVIVGGSTVFGVDATSDRLTIAHRLHEPDCPCVNLGVRGATSQQELVLFLQLKHRLPPVRNVVLLTGVNNCSLAALEGALFFPEYGGVFSEEYHLNSLLSQHAGRRHPGLFAAKLRLVQWLERLHRYPPVAWLLDCWARAEVSPPVVETFPERLERLHQFLQNDLATWRALAVALGCRVHFVLQPALRWTRKPFSPEEEICFQADCERIASLSRYASGDFHKQYRARIASMCAAVGLPFYDANDWLNAAQLDGQTLFTDVCHLTDAGNAFVADSLRNQLNWLRS